MRTQSPKETASVTTSIDEEVPTVQRRTKTLGGVDKWKFAPTVPKVRKASRYQIHYEDTNYTAIQEVQVRSDRTGVRMTYRAQGRNQGGP
jgi:hypothetical protein